MNQQTEINNKIHFTANMVNSYLTDFYSKNQGEIWDAAFHYINAGGKRLRPFILLKCYELLTNINNYKSVLPIASAVEIFHTFSLIHDDIMDKDSMRRGVESVHTRWGNSYAILSGDLLFGLCNFLISMSSLNDSIKTKIMTEMGQVSIDLCQGQALDIFFEQQKDVSAKEYLKMISLKTGALFEKSAAIGGITAGASDEQIKLLRNFGMNLGMSFQVVDDILGLFAEEKKLGKPVGSDIHKGKKTYLIISACENLGKDDVKQLMKILFFPEKKSDDIAEAYFLIEKSGALKKAEELASKYRNEAILSIDTFRECSARNDLYEIANLVVDRKN